MDKKDKISINKRNTAFVELEQYCLLSNKDSHDFMEVTEWTNGEGYDVTISASNQEQMFNVTWGQLKALKKLIKALETNLID
jgi:hypothetical protein